MKAKTFAPVNVALIKYWGKKDEKLRLPMNSSLSVCLEKLGTETMVEWDKGLKEDMIEIDGEKVTDRDRERVVKHLDRVRQLAKMDWRARVKSKNNLPKSVGLSSSASGMAALSLAAVKGAGLEMKEGDLSRLARLAQGRLVEAFQTAGWSG